ncbi:5259_t:CDS:2, partial [Gigaspora margarita]
DILNRKAVKYIIAKPQEAFIEENEEKLKVERIEIETYNIIAKVGTQLSSLLGGIGALKYYESSGVKEIDENTFKPMYLNIEDKVIKQFVKHLKGDAFYNEFAKRKTNRKTNGIQMNLGMKKNEKKMRGTEGEQKGIWLQRFPIIHIS